MSIKQRVPVTEGILQAVEETDPVFMGQLPMLHRWAIKAVSFIGHINLYDRVPVKRIVADCLVDLPLSAAHVNAVFLGDLGSDCAVFSTTKFYHESELLYMGSPYVFKWLEQDGMCKLSVFPWSIRNNNIIFDCDINGQTVTIDMLLHPVDSNNVPLMHREDADTVANFIRLKLVEKEKFKKFRRSTLRSADFAFSKQLEGELSMAIKNARSNDADYSENHRESMSNMIYYPLSGKGNMNLL